MHLDLDKWLAEKRNGEVLIEHIGDFSAEYIDNTIPMLEAKLSEYVEFDCIRKKIFHIFVECIQNLYNHIEPVGFAESLFKTDKPGVLILAKDGSFCRLTTGNFINGAKSEYLKNRIDHINSLTEAEVCALYRETISKDSFSEKGGAGLGMIDIARKTGNKLIYNFYETKNDKNVLFFSFDVYIS